MTTLARILLGAVAGAAIGSVVFGGLSWTVARLARSAHPAPLVLASFLVRAMAALGGFMFLARHAGGIGLLSALVAFILARHVTLAKARM
jgi:F1F0 ATPase subunit 2